MRVKWTYALITVITVLILLAGSSGCGEKAPLKLTTRQWARVDTLFQEQIPLIRSEMDSLCALDFESNLQRAIDSLVELRMKEERELRERIPRKK